MEFELRALSLPGRCSTMEECSPVNCQAKSLASEIILIKTIFGLSTEKRRRNWNVKNYGKN
jgi:hypothetical protein